MHRIAFRPGAELNDAALANFTNQAFDYFTPEILVSHFAAFEAQRGLYLVAFFQKTQNVFLLGLVVMFVHVDAELDFLNRNDFLLFLGSAFLLLFFVEVFAVVLNAADRRVCGGRNFHEIQTSFSCDLQGLERRHNAQLVSFIVYHAYFTCPNTIVDTDKALVDAILRKFLRLAQDA